MNSTLSNEELQALLADPEEKRKKISALLSKKLHGRLVLHSTITGNSINQIISHLIQVHIPEYLVTAGSDPNE